MKEREREREREQEQALWRSQQDASTSRGGWRGGSCPANKPKGKESSKESQAKEEVNTKAPACLLLLLCMRLASSSAKLRLTGRRRRGTRRARARTTGARTRGGLKPTEKKNEKEKMKEGVVPMLVYEQPPSLVILPPLHLVIASTCVICVAILSTRWILYGTVSRINVIWRYFCFPFVCCPCPPPPRPVTDNESFLSFPLSLSLSPMEPPGT